jgi:hypothetical protein
MILLPYHCSKIINTMNNTCGNCGLEASKKCGKCKIVMYCNKECQLSHWSTHRLICVERRPIDDIWEKCRWKTPQNAKQKNTCVLCQNKNVITKLKDDLEIKEYQISGMCTECQGKLFCDEDTADFEIPESIPPK